MTVAGRVLPPSTGDALKVEVRRRAGEETLHVHPGTGKDAICGTLVLPWVTRAGRLRMLRQRIAPPAPWRSADVDAMWRASAWLRLARALNAPELLDARASTRTRPAVNWEALDATLSLAKALLRRRPTTNERRLRRAPIDLPAGVEEGLATERELGAGVLPATMGPAGPTAAAAVYVTRHSPAWRSQRLYGVLTGLLGLIEAAISPYVRDGSRLPPALLATLAPLRAVAERIKDPQRRPEREPSSWPLLARQLLGAAVHASQTTGQTRGPGVDRAPACRLWQIYEDWVLERTASILRRLLGPALPAPTVFPMRWHLPNGTVVELHDQKGISWTDPKTIGHRRLVAVVGASLRPDALLAVTPPGEQTRILVIDAKAYASLDHDAVASEASKYLWGLRDAPPGPGASPGQAPAVGEVVLVAPSGGQEPLAPRAASRVGCVAAAPHLPQPTPAGVTSQPLNALAVSAWLAHLGMRV